MPHADSLPFLSPSVGNRLADRSVRSLVLVVNGDETVRLFILEVLRDEGFQTESSDGGLAVLQRTGTDRSDLVILSPAHAHTGGEAMAEAMRTAYGVNLPVLILHTDHRRVASAGHAGQYQYLTMPFKLEVLIATVERLLASDTPGGQALPAPARPEWLAAASAPAIVRERRSCWHPAPTSRTNNMGDR